MPPRSTHLLVQAALTLALLATLAPAAAADYAPGGEPASASGNELGDSGSNSPVISRDGRYVAFKTEARTLLTPISPDPANPYTSAIVRKDLVTGTVSLVTTPGGEGAISINADARYVLFESNRQLSPDDGNIRVDVYLRDMTRAATDVTAYEVVSALDGEDRAASYTGAGGSRPGRIGYGLSADGRTAVFWTNTGSDLPGGAGSPAPAGQVFVRRLDSNQTLLVTRDKADPSQPGTPVPQAGSSSPAPVISGNGHVIAWQDTNASAQTGFLPGEGALAAHYLWRDLSDGPAASARRLTGMSDPDDPACGPGTAYVEAQDVTGPCYGPFSSGEALDPSTAAPANRPLSISDDGRLVVFGSSALRRPNIPSEQRQGFYLIDMTPGLSRKQATSEPVTLTQAFSDRARSIQEAALSADGRYLAFSSRNNFFFGPQPIGSFQSGPLTATNVFVMDLASNTVERATRAADGSDYVGRLADPLIGTRDDTLVQGLSLSADAAAIAFQAADGNLFVGDANGVTDVQVVRRSVRFAPPALPAAPEDETVPRPARISRLRPVHPVIGYVRIGRGGVATVIVRVPAAGRVSADALGRAAGRRLTVARVTRRLSRAATVKLRLPPSKKTRQAVRRLARLKVRVQIRYQPRRGPLTRATRGYTLSRRAIR